MLFLSATQYIIYKSARTNFIKKIFLIIFLTTVLFCSKKDNAVICNEGILGKWELNEYYAGIGGAFEMADSISIKFLNTTGYNGEMKYQYKLENNNSVLTISLLCFEGCSYMYKAIP
ncbi:MAG TPA: hypothetical protein PLA68_16780 [Panacibacter sp.]|nr:hypothetical protein [Panacibacter sp.]